MEFPWWGLWILSTMLFSFFFFSSSFFSTLIILLFLPIMSPFILPVYLGCAVFWNCDEIAHLLCLVDSHYLCTLFSC